MLTAIIQFIDNGKGMKKDASGIILCTLKFIENEEFYYFCTLKRVKRTQKSDFNTCI